MVVYLEISPDTAFKRLKGTRHRPLIKAGVVKEKISTMIKDRKPLYEENADITFNTDNRSVREL